MQEFDPTASAEAAQKQFNKDHAKAIKMEARYQKQGENLAKHVLKRVSKGEVTPLQEPSEGSKHNMIDQKYTHPLNPLKASRETSLTLMAELPANADTHMKDRHSRANKILHDQGFHADPVVLVGYEEVEGRTLVSKVKQGEAKPTKIIEN